MARPMSKAMAMVPGLRGPVEKRQSRWPWAVYAPWHWQIGHTRWCMHIYIYQIYNINISWHKVVYLILFHCIPYWRSCISLYIYTCIMMYMCMGIWDWEVMCSKVQCFELWFTLRWRPNAPSKAEYCGQFPCMLGLFLVASNLMPAESSSKMVIVPGTPMGPRTSANGRTALKKKLGVDGVSRNAIPLQFIWQLYIAI